MKTKKISFDYRLTKDDEKKYIRVPFEIPADTERVDISYSYKGMHGSSLPDKEKNVIDLAVLDPSGADVGATGSVYNDVFFGETDASPGYRKVKLTPGTWQIILGAYLIKQEGVTVHYDVTFTLKEYRWVRGDTHLHSVNSDGKYTYESLAARAKKAGLGFLVFTDHNNRVPGELPPVNGITLIKGLELTNYYGHINYWGPGIPYDGSYAANNFEEFLALNETAGARGALRVINHPTCTFCPWKWGTDFPFEGVEVWNGPMRHDNMSAIELWDSLLKQGKKVFAAGGSDFHNFTVIFGIPTTAVYARSAAEEDVMEAFRLGRSVLLHDPSAAMLYITSGDAVPGDTVSLAPDTAVTVTAERLQRGQTLLVYDQSGIIHRHKARKTGEYTVTLPVTQAGYVRAEIQYYKKGIMKFFYYVALKAKFPQYAKEKQPPFVWALTNPIYFD